MAVRDSAARSRRSPDLAKTADRRSPGFWRPMRLAQTRLHTVIAFRETTGP